MREIRTSGLMSGVWETGRRFVSTRAQPRLYRRSFGIVHELGISLMFKTGIETSLDAPA
jgi:hypothetical protein